MAGKAIWKARGRREEVIVEPTTERDRVGVVGEVVVGRETEVMTMWGTA